MENFQEAREKAVKYIKIADHMLNHTYPLIKDSRLLLAALENTFLALTNSVASLLYYERTFKSIPPFQPTFESKFNLFREACIRKYKIEESYLTLMLDLKAIITDHKKSPVEFTRSGSFVICDERYRTRIISVDEMKKYISKTKMLIEKINSITSKNEGIFK